MTKTVLILTANPSNTSRLRLDVEVREISNGLQQAQRRDEFILQQQHAVQIADMRRAMLKYQPQFVHFCGHGEGTAGLVFENEKQEAVFVSTEALSGFFRLFSTEVQCVLLNACYSEVQAAAIAEHINYVIGMNQQIGDQAAIEFAVAFYDALGAGKSIEFAYQMGCSAIQMAGFPEELTPVLKVRTQKPVETAKTVTAVDSYKVFLAETPDDLQTSRLQVKQYLEQQNIQILPSQLYHFPTLEQLQQTIADDLAQTHLYVQLLSATQPQRPPGMSTPQLQFELAQKHSLPRLQWRDPYLDLNTVDDQGQRQLLENAMAISLEEFKQEIIQKLANLTKAKQRAEEQQQILESVTTRDTLVFIDAIAEDIDLAREVGCILEKQGIGYSLPLLDEISPGEKRQDLEDNLTICHAVIVVYGRASPTWVRQQILQCVKMQGRRDNPLKIIAVCNKMSPQKTPLDMRLPRMKILDCPTWQELSCLPTFMQALK